MTKTNVGNLNPLITRDPVAKSLDIPVQMINCKNCMEHSELYSKDGPVLWCCGWCEEVNDTDFCSFFDPSRGKNGDIIIPEDLK